VAADRVRAEVVYALPERQLLVALELDDGSTALDAVRASGILDSFSRAGAENLSLAIWGKRIEPGRTLNDGDRVEILRPLQIDPREARRQLAEKGGVMGS
jgi:putative ubiquitin-RnfH superfamily antitoxin RatB of RatAB toxin-antitoxin module